MPVAIPDNPKNAPRPPTTTSRRGGRARSPVSNVPRSSVNINSSNDPPSSAAAAAAAAAKAYGQQPQQNSSQQQHRPPSDSDPNYSNRRQQQPPPYPNHPGNGNNNWPGEQQQVANYAASSRGGRGPSYPGYERYPGREDFDRRYRGGPPPGYPDARGRYPGGGPPPPGRYPYDPSYRYPGRRHGGQRPYPPRGQHAAGGPNIIFGSATPTHLPKSPISPSKERRQRAAASVFRKTPKEDSSGATPPKPTDDDDDDEDSPHKLLLSLRTPTTSFEKLDDKKKGGDSKHAAQRSPAEQHHQPLFPQKSGDGSIGLAPSFNLFNPSFESFGDAHYFNVEGSLQADSFGLGRTDSVGAGGAEGVIRNNSSGQPFLNPSGSGALTLGYSPVNSFGGAGNNISGGGNTGSQPRGMMVVGGPDGRSSSPTQVLGMYRSFSRPLDDSHMRMSVGSFGGHSSGPYGAPPYYMGSMMSQDNMLIPPFYVLLRKYKDAFKNCQFLLPGIRNSLPQEKAASKDANETSQGGNQDSTKPKKDDAPSSNEPSYQPVVQHSSFPGGPHHRMYEPTAQDLVIARRRVESSVCAFGGNLNPDVTPSAATKKDKESIFRDKDKKAEDQDDGKKIKSEDSPSPSAEKKESEQDRKRRKYVEELSSRYYENDSRLSWEFEENPPIEISEKGSVQFEKQIQPSSSSSVKHDASSVKKEAEADNPLSGDFCRSVSSVEGDNASASTDKKSTSTQAKMKYRCKLCGQPKQNHRCPYQQSLARSIGAQVYPAVNAFTADEPGTVAAPLSEMNNFVDLKDDVSSTRPTPDRSRRMVGASAQVTPDSFRSNSRPRHRGKKRMYSQMKHSDQGDLLFVEAMELIPEQFKIVSPMKTPSPNAYKYPALPLPYAQRKRLSDNLFTLSNDVPKLTDECAQVLREAREKDMWDLAVAELMTQVIVIIHCSERDFRFEGLRQYLLTLGIAC